MVMMRAKQIWHVTSFADVLQLILGILTLVILFTGMFMVFSFSKFYPWYITKSEFLTVVFKRKLPFRFCPIQRLRDNRDEWRSLLCR